MKKLIILLAVLLLVACSDDGPIAKRNAQLDEARETIEDAGQVKRDEISKKQVLAYMEQMTGKYILADIYTHKSEEQMHALNEALTEVEIVRLGLEEKYDGDIPVIEELYNLADEVSNAINEMLSGNYERKVDNMTRIGEVIGKISSAYLNGELPPTAKMVTGIENTLE